MATTTTSKKVSTRKDSAGSGDTMKYVLLAGAAGAVYFLMRNSTLGKVLDSAGDAIESALEVAEELFGLGSDIVKDIRDLVNGINVTAKDAAAAVQRIFGETGRLMQGASDATEANIRGMFTALGSVPSFAEPVLDTFDKYSKELWEMGYDVDIKDVVIDPIEATPSGRAARQKVDEARRTAIEKAQEARKVAENLAGMTKNNVPYYATPEYAVKQAQALINANIAGVKRTQDLLTSGNIGSLVGSATNTVKRNVKTVTKKLGF